MAKKLTVSEKLRQVILSSDVTRYRISVDTGIEQATLSRFVSGKSGLALDAVDRLANYFNLELREKV